MASPNYVHTTIGSPDGREFVMMVMDCQKHDAKIRLKNIIAKNQRDFMKWS
jgi:hypothetical protein